MIQQPIGRSTGFEVFAAIDAGSNSGWPPSRKDVGRHMAHVSPGGTP